MKKNVKYLALMPVLLLTACNFKFEYFLPDGVTFYSEGGAWEDEGSDIDDSGTYTIKVWVDKKIQSLTEAQINNFASASGGKIRFNATVQAMSEGDAATKMLQDVDAGADIFVFAQDQLSRLKTANAISALSSSMAAHMLEVNMAESCTAATLGDKMYAYPMTSDNGYFLYYDNSVLSETDVKDMSTMLSKLSAKKKKLNFARGSGFYSISYFTAQGIDCYSHWTCDDRTGRFLSYEDNYSPNNENAVKAAMAFREVCDNSVVATKSTWTNSAAAIITGIWEYEYIKEMYGSHMACTELPSFKAGNNSYHMSSFDGYKLMGVKPQKDKKKASALRKLAEYLTNYENQLNRFRSVSWGPSNIQASNNSEVLAHPGLNALKAQHVYAHQQEQCPGEWFNALGGMCTSITPTSTEAQIKALLSNYQKGLPELLDD